MRTGTITIPTKDVVGDLSMINAQLAALYRRAAGVENADAFVPVVRTLLLNLVVYTNSTDAVAEAVNDLAAVMGTHPCRAIIVNLGKVGSSQPAATVSTICGITERGDRRLCGEIIELHAAALDAEIVGMVMPLLVPDVPVFMWVPNDAPCAGREFSGIAEVADHVIVDSRRFPDLRAGLEWMGPLCVRDAPERTLQDLGWISLHPWMDLAAQHFDPSAARRYLAKLTDIEVKYNPSERADIPPSAPLLMASWLMERTGLDAIGARRASEGGFHIEARQDGRTVDARLIPEDQGYEAATLNSVTIRGGDASGTASFVTHRVSDTRISATEECAGICFAPMVVEFPAQNAPSLVAGALDSFGRDQVYEDAVAVAVRILSQLT